MLEAEPNATGYLEHRTFAARREGDRIVSVDAVAARGGIERRFVGSIFIDTTGAAMLGMLAGAQTLFGVKRNLSMAKGMSLWPRSPPQRGTTIGPCN